MHAYVSICSAPEPVLAVVVAEAPSPPPGNPRGEAMVAELTWVHDMIRRDLRTVRQMAADAAAGGAAGQIQAGIGSLAASSPLWQLKVGCLHYCRFVHSHHHAESVLLFPALRRANPALNPVVDKLEADHASVSDLLGEVETAARELSDAEDPAARTRLVDALHKLSADLLAHLQYEEDHISDTLRTWSDWPFG
jgi:hypothetical protein